MGDLGGIYYVATELFELSAGLTGIEVPEGSVLEIGKPKVMSHMSGKV